MSGRGNRGNTRGARGRGAPRGGRGGRGAPRGAASRGAPARGAARGAVVAGRARGRGAPRGGRGADRGGRGGRGAPRGGRGGAIPQNAPQPQQPKAEDTLEDISQVELPSQKVAFEVLTPAAVKDLKQQLLNTVAAALINEPRPSVTNPSFVKITTLCKKIAFYDPEFVLKLALYVRDDLNIRSTANYLIAMASNIKECQPHVRKYFKAAIRLPSDWLEVAAFFLVLPDKSLKGNAIPTCLRKAMIEKFPDFDAYQLGKYNKERNLKRKQKKLREQGRENDPKKNSKPGLTIKQMIRQLHISFPNTSVMCILGKKYPMNIDEFRNSGLPGVFDPTKAGTRMKLPTPETWETLVSEKGNKASTWEELIEHKKLPFMAMLRNLRNLIYTGVQPRYHRWVQNKLSNEQTVVNSRQFPFRFFSAYEIIPRDLEHFKQLIQEANKGTSADKSEGQKRRTRKKPILPAVMPPASVFEDYRKALDNSVKLATTFNVSPIKGATVVFCNVSQETQSNCSGARGLGSSVRSIQDIGYLLGLMCKYVCEECDFRIYSSKSDKTPDSAHLPVELAEGTILDNMKRVAEKAKLLGPADAGFPFEYLENLISQKKKIDNLMVLSHKAISPSGSDNESNKLSNLLSKYRQEVNPELLFVSVDLSGSGRANIGQDEHHPYDIQITGFSEQILRFIAERGDNNQLQYVEHIDEAKKILADKGSDELDVSPWWRWLDTYGQEQAAPVHYPNITVSEAWRECRVFISSTFLDMHAERDCLTRIVFPELKERLKKRRVKLVEVDLRWGITEEESQHGKSMELCLSEVERCRPFFIGMLGERYGWAPKKYDVSDDPRFDWVRAYPAGRSITELEMQLAALSNPAQATGSFFYLRDRNFIRDVPTELRKYFIESEPAQKEKLKDLRDRIASSGLPVFNYAVRWRGMEEGKAMVDGLDAFGTRVFEDLWSAIDSQFPEEAVSTDEIEIERSFHQAFVSERTMRFVGRQEQLESLNKFAHGDRGKLAVVTGTPGDGKSSLTAAFAKKYAEENPTVFVLSHFIGASPNSTDIRHTLFRLCSELKLAFGLTDEVPEDFNDLVAAFESFLEQASYKGRVLVVLDSLNQLDDTINRAQSLDWLPVSLPCKFVVSTYEGKCLEALRQRKGSLVEVKMTALSVPERTQLVRDTLIEYHKKLDERPMNNQMRVLLRKLDAGKPLYLTVACEELRVFGVYEQVSDKIKDLGMNVAKLFDGVFQRLEGDHGKELVESCLGLIACSRGGLLEHELVQILSSGSDMSQTAWMRLYRSLAPFLKPSGEGADRTLNFFHEQLHHAVEKRYIKKGKAKQNLHRRLAQYFHNCADPHDNNSWEGHADMRAISELPFHLTHAHMWNDLRNVLCDLRFIQHKCSHGLTYDLIQDLTEACRDGLDNPHKGTEREFLTFVKGSAHVLTNNAELTFQQASNQPDISGPAKAAKQMLAGDFNPPFWFKWSNKPQQSDFCKMNLSGFPDAITAAAFSPDGKMLACASKDCSVKLFNAHTGSELATFTGHSNWVVAVSFSPDGRQLVSAAWDNTMKIWDTYTLTESATLEGHSRRVNDCTFSHDGQYILSASWDCTMMLWNASEVKPKRTFRGHLKPVHACCFSADDKLCASGSWDGSIKIYEVENANVVFTLTGHTRSIRSVAFSPSGKHLVSASRDNTVILWDAKAGKMITRLTTHNKPVNSVAFSDDGKHLVSSSDDGTVKVWDANLGKEKQAISIPSGYMNSIVFHPTDSTKMATGSSECHVAVWDIAEGKEILRMEGHTRAINWVDYSADGKYIASCSDEGTVFIWNAETGELCRKLEAHKHPINCVAFSPVVGDTRLATCSDDFTIGIWDIATGAESIPALKGHESSVRSIAWDPNGKMIASAARDRSMRVWDSRNGNCILTRLGHKDWLNSVAFSPDGKQLVTGSWDYNLKMWHMRKEGETATLSGHDGSICMVRYMPSGKHIVSSSYDGQMKIWDAESATEITTLQGHKQRINSIAVSNDGRFVASASDDATIKIWDPLASTELHTLVGHSNVVRKVAFAPETKLIASASDDGTVKIWDVGIGKEEDDGFGSSYSSSLGAQEPAADQVHKKREQIQLAAHSSQINDVCVSSDFSVLLTASDDGTCAFWDINIGRKLRTMRHKAEDLAVRACSISADDNLAITASDDGSVFLWDLRAKKRSLVFAGSKDGRTHAGPATSCSFSSNGLTVATGGWDNTVRVWDARSGKLGKEFGHHTDWVTSCRYARSSSSMITGGWDKRAYILNRERMDNPIVLNGHEDFITDCCLRGDSAVAATCSSDGTVKLWDGLNGSEITTIPDDGSSLCDRVNKVTFHGDNLVFAGSDGVHVWKDGIVCEFFTQAPATALASGTRNDKSHIVVGDRIGNVYVLKMMGVFA